MNYNLMLIVRTYEVIINFIIIVINICLFIVIIIFCDKYSSWLLTDKDSSTM